jgi:hypothetical protein
MAGFAVDGELGEHRELDAKMGGAEGGDVVGTARFLAGEVVAGKPSTCRPCAR